MKQLNRIVSMLLRREYYFIYYATLSYLYLVPGIYDLINPLGKIVLFWALALFIKELITQNSFMYSSYLIWPLLLLCCYFITVFVTDRSSFFCHLTARAHTFFMIVLLYAYRPDKDCRSRRLHVIVMASRIFSGVSSLILLASLPFYLFLIDFFELNGKNHIGFLDNRLTAFFSEPNYGAVYCGLCMILCIISLYIIYQEKAKISWYFVITFSLNFMQVILSRSRSGVLSLTIAVFVIAFFICRNLKVCQAFSWVQKAIIPALLSCLLFVIFYYGSVYVLYRIPVYISGWSKFQEIALDLGQSNWMAEPLEENERLPELDVTRVNYGSITSARMEIWTESITIWKESPIIGVGRNNIQKRARVLIPNGYLAKGYASSNIFIEVLLTCGILGLTTLLVFLGACAIRILKYLFSTHELSFDYYIVVFLFALLGHMTCGSFLISAGILTNDFMEIVYWTVLGMAMFWVSKDQPQEKTILYKVREKLQIT